MAHADVPRATTALTSDRQHRSTRTAHQQALATPLTSYAREQERKHYGQLHGLHESRVRASYGLDTQR